MFLNKRFLCKNCGVYGLRPICLIDADDMRFVHFSKTENNLFEFLFHNQDFYAKTVGSVG